MIQNGVIQKKEPGKMIWVQELIIDIKKTWCVEEDQRSDHREEGLCSCTRCYADICLKKGGRADSPTLKE